MIDARAGSQNLHRDATLLNGIDQCLARASIRQEVGSGNAMVWRALLIKA